MTDELAGWMAHARSAWPEVAVDDAQFLEYLGERADDYGGLSETIVGDLYLACGCARGDAHAVRHFEAHFVTDIDSVLRRMRVTDDLRDEVKQTVRDKLLVGKDGERPKIADYSGRGALRSWLRAAATRTALDALRGRMRLVSSDEELYSTLQADMDDPETAAVRQKYAPQFAVAFRESFADLSERQRLLIKLHFVDGLSTDQLGTLHRVHRVTVLRWLTQALEALAARAQDILLERLKLPKSEYQSLARLVRSQLDISIGALCR